MAAARRASGYCFAAPKAALERLTTPPFPSLTHVFSHGRLIQAERAIVTQADLNDRGKMLRFWQKGKLPAIGSAELVQFSWFDAGNINPPTIIAKQPCH